MAKKRAVIIVETDFRDEEGVYPYYRLKEAGLDVEVATVNKKVVYGKFGVPMPGTVSISELSAEDYDLVLLPGGNEGPERLRTNQDVLKFVYDMHHSGKLVAAICHGPWILISAKLLKGRRATGYKAIVDDLVNAGAEFVDEPVVVDDNIITSRHPRDLPDFMAEVVSRVG